MKLLLMLFLHVVDDYYLQGILAQLKQRSYWKKHAPDEMYEFDYLWALLVHGFSWAFMVMLPFLSKEPTLPFYGLLIANTFIHAYIDNLKANKRKINLCEDQLLHILQIVSTYVLLTQGVF